MIGSLPFILDLNFVFEGVLRLEDEELILEWRRVKSWPFKTYPPEQAHVPLSQLESIEFKSPIYLFHAMLRIRVRNMEALAQVPHSHGAEITLYCKKKYRNLARDIANMATFQKLAQVFPDHSSQTNI